MSLFNNSDHQIQSKLSLWQLPSSGWTWGKRIHFSLYKVPKTLDCQPISVQVCFLAEHLDCVSVHLRQASERPITIDNPWFVHQWRSNGHWVESSVGERNVPSHVSLHQTNQLSVILALPVFASTPEWDTVLRQVFNTHDAISTALMQKLLQLWASTYNQITRGAYAPCQDLQRKWWRRTFPNYFSTPLSFINSSWGKVSLVESRSSSIRNRFKYLWLNDVIVETKNPPPSNLRWLELSLWAFHRNRLRKFSFFIRIMLWMEKGLCIPESSNNLPLYCYLWYRVCKELSIPYEKVLWKFEQLTFHTPLQRQHTAKARCFENDTNTTFPNCLMLQFVNWQFSYSPECRNWNWCVLHITWCVPHMVTMITWE